MAFQNTAFQATAWMLAGTVAVTPFSVFDVNTAYVAKRTLYYQDITYVPPPPPAPVVAATTTTSTVTRKTLFYQAVVQPVVVPTASNLTTTLEWMPSWRGPPLGRLLLASGAPFVPKEAVRENTQTPDQWMPVWRGPPSYQPIPVQSPPFVPEEAVLENTVPTGWFNAWKGPPAYQTNNGFSIPFIPFQAPAVTPDQWMRPFTSAVPALHLNVSQITYATAPVAEDNTVTIDKWKLEWNLAAKTPRPIHTQPFFGYPYEGIDNTRREWDWTIQWKGPPSYQPPRIAAQPFVPKEAVLENTVTPDAWLFRWAKAVPVPKPVPTQPVFGYPYTSQAIVVPYEQWWHQPLSRAVARPPVHAKPYQPFVPREAVLDNTQTPNKWLQAWKGPPRYQPVKTYYQPWSPRPIAAVVDTVNATASVTLGRASSRTLHYQSFARPITGHVFVPNTETIDKWMVPLSKAVARPPVWMTPSWVVAFAYEGVVTDEGPADEHERVACVPLASRVAIVPELSRVVDVPFSGREQDSNEYRDRSCGTPEAPAAVEPEVPTGTDGAFQDDPFDDDAFDV